MTVKSRDVAAGLDSDAVAAHVAALDRGRALVLVRPARQPS
jgi:hypothetical protein